jgi:predicted dinucleotide-binding enzyme
MGMPKVTIIGAGNMGRGIGTRLASENQLQVLAPTPEHATGLADELGSGTTGGGVDDPIAGEVVVLATPYDAAIEFASRRGEDLNGKVVVDITTPVDWASFDRLVPRTTLRPRKKSRPSCRRASRW